MRMIMRNYVKKFTPPILFAMVVNFANRKYGFFGDFESWEEAKKKCTGYDDSHIFEKVKQAALKVKKGEAFFERDSVLFDEAEYSWPVLASIMFIAARSAGRLSVLDFGGSLGSSYFQNIKFFDGLIVEWSIVEQPHFVEFGKSEIEDRILKFYFNIEECLLKRSPNVVLLSSVLQYFENPYKMIEKICSLNVKYIIIDRTPFNRNDQDKILVQKVPPSIYEASYPLHVLSEAKISNILAKAGFKKLEQFHSMVDSDSRYFVSKGMIFEQKS